MNVSVSFHTRPDLEIRHFEKLQLKETQNSSKKLKNQAKNTKNRENIGRFWKKNINFSLQKSIPLGSWSKIRYLLHINGRHSPFVH